MEASSSPARKKIKLDVFTTFFDKYPPEDMCNLQKAIRRLLSDEQSFLKALTLKAANCSASFSFKHAYVTVEEHIKMLYPFGTVFSAGLRMLTKFLKTKDAPVEDTEQKLLEVLLTYLQKKELHGPLGSMNAHCRTETQVTIMTINHLLLRVTTNPHCLLDNGVSYSVDDIINCPDKCQIHPLNTDIADTTIGDSNVGLIGVHRPIQQLKTNVTGTDRGYYLVKSVKLGNPMVWHGRIDALIGQVALTRLVGHDEDDEADDNDDSAYRFVDTDSAHPQVLSQAIVFSFLQNNKDSKKEKLKKTLVPTIGISSTQLVIYFYDSENDVLLQSACFNFDKESEEKLMAILVAWLVVNYKHLGDGLNDKLLTKIPKADFVKVCDANALHIYQTKIVHGAVGRGVRPTTSCFKYNRSTLEILPETQEILDELDGL